jgi:hypothetical protein
MLGKTQKIEAVRKVISDSELDGAMREEQRNLSLSDPSAGLQVIQVTSNVNK